MGFDPDLYGDPAVSYDYEAPAEPEGDAADPGTLSRRQERKRAKAKAKAEKSFARQYGGSAGGASMDGGPRAAVYKGEMGSTHRKASRMQDGTAYDQAGYRRNRGRHGRRNLSGVFVAFGTIAACFLLAAAFLYSPARDCYQQMRELQRLEAEYEAVTARNEGIRQEVEALMTDEGIEDKARMEFGWVKEGENAVSVSGLDKTRESTFSASIIPGSVEPPVTWYSPWLDPIFGVD